MKKIATIIFPILLLCLSIHLAGQEANLEKAVRDYNRMGYMSFVGELKDSKNIQSVGATTAGMMGNSYRLNGNYEAAAYWYARAVNEESAPEYLLYYAQALQSCGDCAEATEWYKKYLEKAENETGDINRFIADCDYAIEPVFGAVEISPVEGINSEGLDYCAVPVEGGLIFTSTRKKYQPILHNDRWTEQEFTDLFFAAKKDDESYETPQLLHGALKKRYHDGAVAVTAGGDKMYFTRSNSKGKNANDVIDFKIYSAELVNGKWDNIRELPFNSEDFGTGHPAVSSDGSRMVFTSNRPGGLGGMDLYYTEWVDGSWSEPVNLGAEINTSGNEVFPHLDNQQNLFFSSDSRPGVGGLDIFMASAESEGKWANPRNLGPPINSLKDDFGFYVMSDGNEGFLSSNRNFTGKGGDDIYSWKATTSVANVSKSIEQLIRVIDGNTAASIPGASVGWAEMTGQQGIVTYEGNTVTSDAGSLTILVVPSRQYIFNVRKPGYEPKRVTVTSIDFENNPSGYVIPLVKIPVMEMTGEVIAAKSGNAVPGASVELINHCNGSTEYFKSSPVGHFTFEAECGCNYEMVAKKDGYVISRKSFKADCVAEKVGIALSQEGESPMPAKSEYVEGQVIKLENLYYDLDKWYIRPDAAEVLDEIVDVLKKNPGMEIELSSHTDSRGNDAYNMNLSEKRAKSAVDYIVSKGISKNRLSAKGYGESSLANHCSNDVKCSSSEHQENRRTEVKIIKTGN